MAFSPEEQQIINWSMQNGKSSQEIKDAILRFRLTGSPKGEQQEPQEETAGYLSRVGSTIAEEATGIKESVERGAEIIQEANQPQKTVGEKLKAVVSGFGRSALGAMGGATRAIFSPITEAVSPLISPTIEKIVQDNPEVQTALENFSSWANENPDKAANVVNAIEVITAVGGVKLGKEILRKSLNVGGRVAEATGAAVAGGAKGVTEATAPILKQAARIPSRIGTNLEARKAFEQEIKALPTQTAKNAARDGIDISDIKFIYNIPKESKSDFVNLANAAKEFSNNPRATNPIELVGKPITEKVKFLDQKRMEVGKALGEAADNLGVVTKPELSSAVFKRLTSVSGLQGLTIKNGVLDFSKTSLASTLSKSDRKAIQEAFTQATRWGDGKRAHLFRQELFEILGGKKKSLSNITDTQERAFEAIRRGLSDVLETKNPSYKELSNEYRKIIQPLSDLRRIMKTVPDATEDILDMQAGLFASRLTSMAPSNPKIRAILRALDDATQGDGSVLTRVEDLQDFYNILNRYYDLSGETSFQGLVTTGIEQAGGVGDIISKTTRGFIGETQAVKQKALENAIIDALQ